MCESSHMLEVKKVQREVASLRQQVTQSLRDAILDGRLKPGQRLVERELCELLDISRTLLREALQQLQAEGLVTTILHKGPSVALIGAKELSQIYQVRQALESLVGRGFAANASNDQVQELRRQLELVKATKTAHSPRDILVAKGGFYTVLFDGCGNSVASMVLTQLNNRMLLYKHLSLSAPGRVEETMAELEAIVSAIEMRDAEEAARLCAVHVANAAGTVQRQLAAIENREEEKVE